MAFATPIIVPHAPTHAATGNDPVALTEPQITNAYTSIPIVANAAVLDMSQGPAFYMDMTKATDNVAMTALHWRAGVFILTVYNDGVHSISWTPQFIPPAPMHVWVWAGGIVPTPTATYGSTDVYTFFCDGVGMVGNMLADVKAPSN